MNYRKIAIFIFGFTVCFNPMIVLADATKSQTATAAQGQQAKSKQAVARPSSQQAGKRPVRSVKKKVKKSRARKIAKKAYNSKLLWAIAATGVSVGGFMLLCRQQVVPGFEVMPGDWSEFCHALDVLVNGNISEVDQPKKQDIVEFNKEADNKRVAETLGVPVEDLHINDLDEEVSNGFEISEGAKEAAKSIVGGTAALAVLTGVMIGLAKLLQRS